MQIPGAHDQGGYGAETDQRDTDNMATLGRSLKSSSSYFTRARRPGMSPRALSNSSDVSVASMGSNRSEDQLDFVMSAANTPMGELTQAEAMASSSSVPPDAQHHHQASRAAETAGATHRPFIKLGESSSLQPSRSNLSRPIAIEPPHLRKYNSAPNYTPPEPLSARGDRPGGYFPLHEDPTARVHRFQPAAKKSRQPHPTIHLPPDIRSRKTEPPPTLATMPEPIQNLRVNADKSLSSSNTPVASYIPSGAHDTSLPMGKYYPSNYEQRHATPASQTSTMMPPPNGPIPSSSLSSSVKSDSQTSIHLGESIPRTDTKQRLQQYQRDMIAQARLAANQVLGDAPKVTSAMPTATVSLNGVPIQSLQQFGMTSIHKPTSPRLLPLGSPGPVTPMDLEGGEGGYLDRGHGPTILGDSEDIARALRAEVAFLRGPASPAIEAGPQAIL